MYELEVRRVFAAAHQLREHGGSCERIHGHNWEVYLRLCGSQLNPLGLLVDFREVQAALDAAIGELDHSFLNEVPPFHEINPSCEHIARHIFRRCKHEIETPDNGDLRVGSVKIFESEGCSITYSEPDQIQES